MFKWGHEARGETMKRWLKRRLDARTEALSCRNDSVVCIDPVIWGDSEDISAELHLDAQPPHHNEGFLSWADPGDVIHAITAIWLTIFCASQKRHSCGPNTYSQFHLCLFMFMGDDCTWLQRTENKKLRVSWLTSYYPSHGKHKPAWEWRKRARQRQNVRMRRVWCELFRKGCGMRTQLEKLRREDSGGRRGGDELMSHSPAQEGSTKHRCCTPGPLGIPPLGID